MDLSQLIASQIWNDVIIISKYYSRSRFWKTHRPHNTANASSFIKAKCGSNDCF